MTLQQFLGSIKQELLIFRGENPKNPGNFPLSLLFEMDILEGYQSSGSAIIDYISSNYNRCTRIMQIYLEEEIGLLEVRKESLEPLKRLVWKGERVAAVTTEGKELRWRFFSKALN